MSWRPSLGTSAAIAVVMVLGIALGLGAYTFVYARGYSYLGHDPGSLPVTERAARENISLPLWPGITAEQQERVVEVVRHAARVQATT